MRSRALTCCDHVGRGIGNWLAFCQFAFSLFIEISKTAPHSSLPWQSDRPRAHKDAQRPKRTSRPDLRKAAWWIKAGIDPTIPARALWLQSHPLPTTNLEEQNLTLRWQHRRQQARSAGEQRRPKVQNEANYRGWCSITSFRQIEANRRNGRKSTGPITEEGKQRSRCNAVRRGLSAETMIGALEDAEDYKGFEAAIIADYDVSIGRRAGAGVAVSQSALATAACHDDGNGLVRNLS